MKQPLVSIVIPIRNEEAFIERSLGAVLNQDYPQDKIEVWIADGMSTDATLAVIRAMPGAERVHIAENPRFVQAAGLNLVIPQARGKIIVRIDGHTIVAPDYVSRCVELLQQTGAQNVGGAMTPVGITPVGKAIAAAGKSPFAVPSAFHVSDKDQFTDTVYLGAWPAEVFARVGLYNENVGVNEDYELNYRIRQSGGTVFFSPRIRSEYYGRQTLSALARQYYRYGKSKVKTLAQHPKSLRLRHLVAPAFVSWLFLGTALALMWPPFRVVWAVGLLIYFVAAVFFAFRASDETQIRWRIPVVFFTIHTAWGVGFWIGLFQTRQKL